MYGCDGVAKTVQYLCGNDNIEALRRERQGLTVRHHGDKLSLQQINADVAMNPIGEKRSIGLVAAADVQCNEPITMQSAGPFLENPAPRPKQQIAGIGNRRI